MRRVGVVTFALVVAALLLRPFVAEALVSRGDEFELRAEYAVSAAFYARALLVDRHDRRAVDRFVSSAVERRDRLALREAIAVTSELLRAGAQPDLLFDRAMVRRLLGEHCGSARDFEALGKAEHDFRPFGLAAHAWAACGQPRAARSAWRAALALEPRYTVARRALARSSW